MSELLTIKEAAVELGLSGKAVARRIERGAVQSVKKDGRRLIPRGEVTRLIESDSVPAAKGFQAVGHQPRAGSVEVTALLEALERAHLENRDLAIQVARMQLLTEQSESTRQQLVDEIHQLRAELTQAESALEVDVVDVRPRRRLFARNRA